MNFLIGIFAALFLSLANEIVSAAENPQPSDIITSSSQAQPAQFPHVVSIYHDQQNKHICGGVIISKNYILTAARCVQDKLAKYTIKAGTINHKIVDASAQIVSANNIIIHKDFSGGCDNYQKHDIAIVEVTPAFEFNEYVQPVVLPKLNAILRKNRDVRVSGWGLFEGKGKGPVDELRYIVTLMIADPYCQKALEVSRNGTLYENQFCVDYPIHHQVMCEGDSGNPLIQYELVTNNTVLFGIASEVSIKCEKSEEKSVFTQVSKYIDWIEAETGINGAAGMKFSFSMILTAVVIVATKFMFQ